ncbi:hypothetical protein [Enhygromyxa salina]|uniref:Uncharacterized protein n=1 Tax=Enhygromyxa salina TaxID=215803 RepID=A0A2S9Y471_9BACT|nr:hypothetical protein [Enhygromyxa salina]PRP99902.1 hypothetical protein ENSA7_61190 [Enhygromyxa salina]
MVHAAQSLAPQPPIELQFSVDDQPAQICERVASYALREAEAMGSRRFFAAVAVALGRALVGASALEAGAALAQELARHAREAWVRDGIDRGLDLFGRCVDETGRRCVAALVAEYFGWREPPDLFFHRIGSILVGRDAGELVRLAVITSGYARTPKPATDELRLLASVPCLDRAGSARTRGLGLPPSHERRLTIVAFAGEPRRERLRSATEIPSLGSDHLVSSLARAQLGQLAEPEPSEVPLVGRPLLWFPPQADHDLRRLHLLLAGAIA